MFPGVDDEPLAGEGSRERGGVPGALTPSGVVGRLVP